MKKILSVILLLSLCVTLFSGCWPFGDKEPEEVQLNIIDDKYRNWYEIFVYSFYIPTMTASAT